MQPRFAMSRGGLATKFRLISSGSRSIETPALPSLAPRGLRADRLRKIEFPQRQTNKPPQFLRTNCGHIASSPSSADMIAVVLLLAGLLSLGPFGTIFAVSFGTNPLRWITSNLSGTADHERSTVD